jgi:hypothetical protein
MPTCINRASGPPRDPRGHISRIGLRLGQRTEVWSVDGPTWRSVAAFVASQLVLAGTEVGRVRAGESGRVLLGRRDDFGADQRREHILGTDLFLRVEPMNPHAYLKVIFAVVPADDADFFIEYEPTPRRTRAYRGDSKHDPDEVSLYASTKKGD